MSRAGVKATSGMAGAAQHPAPAHVCCSASAAAPAATRAASHRFSLPKYYNEYCCNVFSWREVSSLSVFL